MPTLRPDDDVLVLDLGDDENRFTPDWMVAVSDLLDEVVDAAPTVLVTTATGKFFSNGLDLEWVQDNPTEFQPYLSRAQRLMARFLELGVPTIAAVQGHAFAAGAMLSLCHDQRVMRADRGFWCLPEIDINLPFAPGMDALVTTKLPARTATLAMTTGARFGGAEALAAGIVDHVAGEGEVLATALRIARPLVGKNVDVLAQIKRRKDARVLDLLRQD